MSDEMETQRMANSNTKKVKNCFEVPSNLLQSKLDLSSVMIYCRPFYGGASLVDYCYNL